MLLHSHTPAAADEPHGHDNQIIPRQRALSAHMCSHKEPWKLRGPAEFPQAGEAKIPFAHSVQRAVAEAAGKKASTEEGLRGGRSIDPTAPFSLVGSFQHLFTFYEIPSAGIRWRIGFYSL